MRVCEECDGVVKAAAQKATEDDDVEQRLKQAEDETATARGAEEGPAAAKEAAKDETAVKEDAKDEFEAAATEHTPPGRALSRK